MSDIPPPPTESSEAGNVSQKIRQDSKIHLMFAVLLAIFVAAGYYPSAEGPKYEPIEHKEISATASVETRTAIDKDNADIDKKNIEGQQKIVKTQREWEKHGRENHLALLTLARFGAALFAALWVVFFVCSYLVKPLLKFLKDFLGEDFAKVITPIVLLGVAYVLAQIVVQNSSVKELPTHGLVATIINFANHIIRPFLGFVIDFTEFVVKNWTVGLVYLSIVVYAIIRKFVRPVQ